jgi:hypothetical protein
MEVIFILMFLGGIGTLVILLLTGNRDEEEIVFEEVRNPATLHIAVPRQNEKTPLAAEQMFASLHGILRDNERSTDFLSFEIISAKQTGINFCAVVPQYLVKFVEGQIYAQYPNAEIEIIADYVEDPIPGTDPSTYKPFVSTGEIELAKGFIFPIKTFRDFEVDPLAAITSALSGVVNGEQVMIQILIRPVANYWQEVANEYIEAVREGRDPTSQGGFWRSVLSVTGSIFVGALGVFFGGSSESEGEEKPTVRLLPSQEEELRRISEKMTKVGFEMGIRVVAKASTAQRSERLLKDAIASFKQFTTANLNSFIHSPAEKTGAEMYDEYKKRFLSVETADIVNIEELASLYHLPNESVETPNISWSRAKKAEPPMNLPINDGTIFAETDFRGQRLPFGIRDADRRMHFYLLGKTGTGKSTVFKNMVISDILKGKGVGVVDPHGELVSDILEFIPSNRINDVVYLDPADVEYPIGFNLLELEDMDQRDLVADGVVEVFKKHFEYSWGPRLQYILTNAILTALEAQGTTLLAVQRMLIDDNYRKFILKQVEDPLLKNFWEEEFANMSRNSRLVTKAVAPIQNKVGRFLASSTIRNIVGQVSSTINLREIMDTGKIFLVNLSQGRLGEESSALLGGMIVARLQSTAMERVNTPEEERRDFFLYVDEFQNYATDSFAKILSEARKYRLCLHLTHQYIDQLPENVRTAIFGNVGTLCSYVVGPSDADALGKEFTPIFDEEDLVSLERHSMYIKMSVDGMITKPFSARSLDLRYEKGDNKDTVLKVSRERYGRPRSVVEEKIARWTRQGYSDKGNRSHQHSHKKQKNKSQSKSKNNKKKSKKGNKNKKKDDDGKNRKSKKKQKSQKNNNHKRNKKNSRHKNRNKSQNKRKSKSKKRKKSSKKKRTNKKHKNNNHKNKKGNKSKKNK